MRQVRSLAYARAKGSRNVTKFSPLPFYLSLSAIYQVFWSAQKVIIWILQPLLGGRSLHLEAVKYAESMPKYPQKCKNMIRRNQTRFAHYDPFEPFKMPKMPISTCIWLKKGSKGGSKPPQKWPQKSVFMVSQPQKHDTKNLKSHNFSNFDRFHVFPKKSLSAPQKKLS